MASFQFGPWVLWALLLELAILLLFSTWQKGLLKSSESPEMIEELPEHVEEDITPTLDQMAVIDPEIDAES